MKSSKITKNLRLFFIFLTTMLPLALFQNCGKGFEATNVSLNSNVLVSPGTPIGTPTPAPPQPTSPPAPEGEFVSAPLQPNEVGGGYQFFMGTIFASPFFSIHNSDFKWSYSINPVLPPNPRVQVLMHGSGGGTAVVKSAYGFCESAYINGNPSKYYAELTVQNQDAEAYSQYWREWWTSGSDKINYPGRRIAATLDFLKKRYPQIDTENRGIIVNGNSMGGQGSVVQTMILPEPWRSKIAYSMNIVGVILPRRVNQKNPGQYGMFPPDTAENKDFWDSFDFEIQAANDPIVRGIHYRGVFGSYDSFSAGPDGSTQTEFVNLLEKNKIGGAFSWRSAGHDATEPGVTIPDLRIFESPYQDITLDRAHPAITDSTGNLPLLASQRIDEVNHPRGHYNMGIIWDHANIVDDTTKIVFPLKYVRRTAMGTGVPDQPLNITISVTPRRPRHFVIRHGDILKWSWDGGAKSGTVFVVGDTVTVPLIPLVSGQAFKNLIISK